MFSDKSSAIKVYSTHEGLTPKQGIPNGLNPYGAIVIFPKAGFCFAIYADVFDNIAVCNYEGIWKNYSPDVIRNELNNTGILSTSCILWEDVNLVEVNRGIVFFTNWTGSQSFPENYGSGIVFPCADVSNKRILYIGQSGRMYSGACMSNDKNNITWYA